MASNQKLTKLLAGRAIAACTQIEGLLTLTLDDGATMKVKTAPAAAAPPTTTAPIRAPTPGTPAPGLTAPAEAPATGKKVTAPGLTAPAEAPATGKKVKKVRQKGTELNLDLEDGTTWTVQTAEATSSVMLRDKAGKLEYAD